MFMSLKCAHQYYTDNYTILSNIYYIFYTENSIQLDMHFLSTNTTIMILYFLFNRTKFCIRVYRTSYGWYKTLSFSTLYLLFYNIVRIKTLLTVHAYN